MSLHGLIHHPLEAVPEMRGRVMGLWAVAFLGSTPIGGPIAGLVSEAFGAEPGLFSARGPAWSPPPSVRSSSVGSGWLPSPNHGSPSPLRQDAGMTTESWLARWTSIAWRQEAERWVDEVLESASIRRTGPIEQPRVRAWATVLTVPTDAGPLWMKAAAPDTAFEVGLYEVLHRVVPGRVLAPVASDPRRGWLLLPDGGTPLSERGPAVRPAVLSEALRAYGQLQRDVAPYVAELLDRGVPDMRPEVMPQRFASALALVRPQVERLGGPEDRARFVRVAAMSGTVGEWCAELADGPGGASIEHNDLHPGNILPGADGGPVRFYDWGDASVAHPFGSALVALGVAATDLDVPREDPSLLRLRDAYLEPFGDLAPYSTLVRTLELACRIGKIARTHTWARALRLGGDDRFAAAPVRTLLALADDSYLLEV